MGKKTEALELSKKTLLVEFGNFTAWHVYGLVQKACKDYEGARAAYL